MPKAACGSSAEPPLGARLRGRPGQGDVLLHGATASRDVALHVCTTPSGLERESC